MDICGCDDYYKDVWHFGEKRGKFYTSDTTNSNIVKIKKPLKNLMIETNKPTIDALDAK